MKTTSKQQIAALTERVRALEKECNMRVVERDAQIRHAASLGKSVAHASYQIAELRDALKFFADSRICRFFFPGQTLTARLLSDR